MRSSDSHISNYDTESAEGAERRSTSQLLAAISAAISSGDASAAAELIQEAESLHHGDSSLAVPLSKCKVIVRRSEWLDSALDAMLRDLEEDRFASAMGHFREALGLSRGLALLKARVDREAVKSAEELLPENWRIAETLLHEAAITDPPLIQDLELNDRLRQAREHELVSAAIYKVDRAEMEGRKTEARQKLLQLMAAYPEDARIGERLKQLDNPESKPRPELVVKMPAVQVQAIAKLRPPESELDREGTLTDPGPGFLVPWGKKKIFISNSAWNAFKNFAALAATTAMLGTAGVIVWLHFAHPNTHARRAKPAQAQVPLKTAIASIPVTPAPPVAGPQKSIFEDVPGAVSDVDTILHVVSTYRDSSGKQNDDPVDVVSVKGNEATVRYRPKQKGGVGVTFSLVRQGDSWKVVSAH